MTLMLTPLIHIQPRNILKTPRTYSKSQEKIILFCQMALAVVVGLELRDISIERFYLITAIVSPVIYIKHNHVIEEFVEKMEKK